MKVLINILTIFPLFLYSQVPFYKYRTVNTTLSVPDNLNSARSAVIITVPDKETDGTLKVGEWKEIAYKAHRGFRTMGIDAIFYLHERDLLSGSGSIENYAEVFKSRGIENIVFLTRTESQYELMVAPFTKNQSIIENNATVFFTNHSRLDRALVTLGKEIKRSGQELGNFLIPEEPNFLSAVSIVETNRLTIYPGQVRRNKMAIERFQPLEVPEGLDANALALITEYNAEIEGKNSLLDTLLKTYPFDYEVIDRMSNVEMIRNRYQFVLRSIHGPISTLRQMLEYELNEENHYTSIIPIMPDNQQTKSISGEEIGYKFYIRQNISTSLYVGIWDADQDWKIAMTNFLNNLVQFLEKQKR
jgi:hypothetical protein